MVSMGTLLRVLLIEDSPDDAVLLHRELRRAGYEPAIRRVADIPTLTGALTGDVWDVVVADVHVPGVGVLDVLGLVRRRGQGVPCIVVSGHVSDDQAATILTAGAHAFVPKRDLARLVPAVERARREASERAAPDSAARPPSALEPARRDRATEPCEAAD